MYVNQLVKLANVAHGMYVCMYVCIYVQGFFAPDITRLLKRPLVKIFPFPCFFKKKKKKKKGPDRKRLIGFGGYLSRRTRAM